MDDLQFGTRNKRGDWAPNAPSGAAAVLAPPVQPAEGAGLDSRIPVALERLPHGDRADLVVLRRARCRDDADPVLGLGALALRGERRGDLRLLRLGRAVLVRQRKQGTRFKYNGKFPADQPSDVFWFKSQNIDNFLRSFFISIPLWTLVEVLFLWAFANSWAVWLPWETHWPWLVVLALISPAIHEVHFFCIHRLIHVPILYKWIHSVHHNSVNPSPWSSLSMHPVEGFLYHAVAFWHLIIPSNPMLAMYQLHLAGFGAVNGHIGFDKLELTEDTALDSHAYAHYLHHKYFEVNYGGDGLIPLDKWFGYWHDGSKEGEARMNARFEKKKARMNAKAART